MGLARQPQFVKTQKNKTLKDLLYRVFCNIMPTPHKVAIRLHRCSWKHKCPHRIAVLHRIANPGPSGRAGSTPAVGALDYPNQQFLQQLILFPAILYHRGAFL